MNRSSEELGDEVRVGESEWELDENGNLIKMIPHRPQQEAEAEPRQDSTHSDIVEFTQLDSKIIDRFNELGAEITNLEIEWTMLNNTMDSKEKQLAQLVSLHSDGTQVFCDEMMALRRMINENSDRFIKLPKGPLGACISVRSASWVPLIEHILYPYLFIFIVDNRYDYKVLVQMIDEVYDSHPASIPPSPPSFDVMRKPDVWITQFTKKKHNIFDTRIPFGIGYTTLLDMLEFHNGDPDVFNTIHDFIRFEKIILFNNEHDAFLRMVDSYRLPRNCAIGYTKNFMKIIPYPHFRTISLYDSATTFQSTVWPSHNRARGPRTRTARSFESGIASAEIVRNRLKICQLGAKQLSYLMQPQSQLGSIIRPTNSYAPPPPPNPVKLASGEDFDLMKASQFYLLPSLAPTIEALRNEIDNLSTERKIHELIVKLTREARLNVSSQIKLTELDKKIKSKLEINQNSEF